jgi:hypothetical protein
VVFPFEGSDWTQPASSSSQPPPARPILFAYEEITVIDTTLNLGSKTSPPFDSSNKAAKTAWTNAQRAVAMNARVAEDLESFSTMVIFLTDHC